MSDHPLYVAYAVAALWCYSAPVGHLRTIADIWADRYPPRQPRGHQLVEKIVITPILVSRLLSLDLLNRLFSDRGRHVFMDLYVLVFATTLTLILWLPGNLAVLGTAVAVYRLGDIVTYRLYFMLVKSQDRPWDPILIRRSLVIVLINFYETVVGYAVIYLTVGQIATSSPAPSLLRHPLTALYFSFVTATTLGYGDYVPVDDLSRLVVMTQLASSILFLLFLIPALVSMFSTGKA